MGIARLLCGDIEVTFWRRNLNHLDSCKCDFMMFLDFLTINKPKTTRNHQKMMSEGHSRLYYIQQVFPSFSHWKCFYGIDIWDVSGCHHGTIRPWPPHVLNTILVGGFNTVVSTHLKNISQIGSSPQVGVEQKVFEPPHSILWHFTYNLFFESSHNSFISSFTKFASQRCLRTRWAAISSGPGEITQVKPITGRVLPPCKGKTKRLNLCDM